MKARVHKPFYMKGQQAVKRFQTLHVLHDSAAVLIAPPAREIVIVYVFSPSDGEGTG